MFIKNDLKQWDQMHRRVYTHVNSVLRRVHGVPSARTPVTIRARTAMNRGKEQIPLSRQRAHGITDVRPRALGDMKKAAHSIEISEIFGYLAVLDLFEFG